MGLEPSTFKIYGFQPSSQSALCHRTHPNPASASPSLIAIPSPAPLSVQNEEVQDELFETEPDENGLFHVY